MQDKTRGPHTDLLVISLGCNGLDGTKVKRDALPAFKRVDWVLQS